ncbi:hypothetical protein [Flavobacterium sp. GSB-24]|uniref:hypothetical protein n=1 Tax=Flavobacterium sp. GSB-24 TaxID=2994319 RepID=UPI0024918C50|nr:hypothetical protein [Flavobacterium sp. GSB-24]BDU23855.1 hypothetical protein FLGSB24_05990 [Flavobacterium sp. GSB-24]
MKELLIESKGIKTSEYFIPAFELRKGELLLIHIHGTVCFYEMKAELTDIFTGKTQHENVKILHALTFAENFKESRFERIFNSITVSRYLKRNTNLHEHSVPKIFKENGISKNDKVKSLDYSQKKLLSLYSVFTKTKNIVFDLSGEVSVGAIKTFDFVKNEIKNDGAAILIDWAGSDVKDKCSKVIAIEWLIEPKKR